MINGLNLRLEDKTIFYIIKLGPKNLGPFFYFIYKCFYKKIIIFIFL